MVEREKNMNYIYSRKKKEIIVAELKAIKKKSRSVNLQIKLQTAFNRFRHNLDILLETLEIYLPSYPPQCMEKVKSMCSSSSWKPADPMCTIHL